MQRAAGSLAWPKPVHFSPLRLLNNSPTANYPLPSPTPTDSNSWPWPGGNQHPQHRGAETPTLIGNRRGPGEYLAPPGVPISQTQKTEIGGNTKTGQRPTVKHRGAEMWIRPHGLCPSQLWSPLLLLHPQPPSPTALGSGWAFQIYTQTDFGPTKAGRWQSFHLRFRMIPMTSGAAWTLTST